MQINTDLLPYVAPGGKPNGKSNWATVLADVAEEATKQGSHIGQCTNEEKGSMWTNEGCELHIAVGAFRSALLRMTIAAYRHWESDQEDL